MTVTRQAAGTAPMPGARAAGTTGVLTWNVQHASPERAHRQADWLAGSPEADIIIHHDPV